LARQHGHLAIGVILSGAGEDGVAGALELNKYGGTVLVQDPNSSPFNGMPKATIAKDHPKSILAPAELARRIGQLVDLSAQK
jgi:chemotaxis response regulator CheB